MAKRKLILSAKSSFSSKASQETRTSPSTMESTAAGLNSTVVDTDDATSIRSNLHLITTTIKVIAEVLKDMSRETTPSPRHTVREESVPPAMEVNGTTTTTTEPLSPHIPKTTTTSSSIVIRTPPHTPQRPQPNIDPKDKGKKILIEQLQPKQSQRQIKEYVALAARIALEEAVYLIDPSLTANLSNSNVQAEVVVTIQNGIENAQSTSTPNQLATTTTRQNISFRPSSTLTTRSTKRSKRDTRSLASFKPLLHTIQLVNSNDTPVDTSMNASGVGVKLSMKYNDSRHKSQ